MTHTPEPVAWLYTHHEFPANVHLSRWDKDCGGTSDGFIGWTECPLYICDGLNPEAFREVVEALDAMVASYADPDDGEVDRRLALEDARAALAKARAV